MVLRTDSEQRCYPPFGCDNYRKRLEVFQVRGLRHRLHIERDRVAPPIAHGLRHQLRVDKSGFPPAVDAMRQPRAVGLAGCDCAS
jgi:hypothetical protein